MPSQGPNYAGSAADVVFGSGTWSNPSNAIGAPNSQHASVTVAAGNGSDWLALTNFGFNITGTILGVVVAVNGNETLDNNINVILTLDGSSSYGTGALFDLTSSDAWSQDSGSPTDMSPWNNVGGFVTPTAAQVNANTFGIIVRGEGISFGGSNPSGPVTVNIDAVRMTVYYTTSGGGILVPPHLFAGLEK